MFRSPWLVLGEVDILGQDKGLHLNLCIQMRLPMESDTNPSDVPNN